MKRPKGVKKTECHVPLRGGYLVFQSYDSNPKGTEYVRIVDDAGRETDYWDQREWTESPAEVMGAIMGAVLRGPNQIARR